MRELTLARKRCEDQAKAVNQAIESKEHARKHGWNTIVETQETKLKRLNKAHATSVALIAELEKATGALPLAGAKR